MNLMQGRNVSFRSNKDGGSNYMELEGLKRCLQLLDDKELVYTTLVTDPHGPVRKFMRRNLTYFKIFSFKFSVHLHTVVVITFFEIVC